MNTRTMLLLAALLLIGAGFGMTMLQLFDEAPAEPRVAVGVAAQPIEPYTIITQEMLRSGDLMRASEASAKGAWPIEAVVGKMSTARIVPGTLFTGLLVKPIEEVRFVDDLGLEVVSFAAGVDRLVGGQLRPGHLINLYGHGNDPRTNEAFTTLIEPRLWVVGVTAGGSRPVDLATPRPRLDNGDYLELRTRDDPAGTMITIAVEPERAYRIIDALGAQRLSAWVTLAASTVAEPPSTATPRPVAVGPTPDLWATLQAISTAPPGLGRNGYGGMAGK